jgi:hypothetical protein
MSNDFDLEQLAEELAPFAPAEKAGGRSAREERIIAGFEDIQRFVEQHGRPPLHGEGRDIFERMYAVRLDRLRAQPDCLAILEPLDHQGLLAGASPGVREDAADFSLDDLAAELDGVDGGPEITELRHVRSSAEKRAAEEVASRDPCQDFERFRPLFERVSQDIETGARITRRIRKDAGFLKADIKAGEFFVVGGQTAYIAEVGEPIRAPNGEFDARLRVIYSNGTESNILLRSLQRALYKDETSRRVSEPDLGPLFSGEAGDDDLASGTIYVLRSKSDHPLVAAHRDVIHKIGVTNGDVKRRVAGAALDPTFLMADVEVIATYDLYNISRGRFEALIHKIFGPARLEIEIIDRFGNAVIPREWFLAPLFVIDEALQRIRDGTITSFRYDPASASLVATSNDAP